VEAVTDLPERTVLLLRASDELDVTWSRYEPGEKGPDPHVHHGHVDSFFVLEGTMTFELGADGQRVDAGPGTFVSVPPDVVHTFRNASGARMVFLNVHAPSGGFAANLRGETDEWDEHPPPQDGGRDPAEVVIEHLPG
jgi:mannose-6-phosphate isomerase-like protein (cupin superfamily)